MLLLVFSGPAVTSPFASCCFSCEELQDIDLELNVDNSAFYDQFAIAQVGSAARQVRCPAGRKRCVLPSRKPLWGSLLLDHRHVGTC